MDLPDLSPNDAIHGPDGHGGPYQHRGGPPAGGTPSATSPTNGTSQFLPQARRLESALGPCLAQRQFMAGLGHTTRSVSFPQFSGENPKIWITMCEQYFTMFQVHPSYFIPMSTLHFTGPAEIWLQSVQPKIGVLDWDGLCNLLCSRFGRARHQ